MPETNVSVTVGSNNPINVSVTPASQTLSLQFAGPPGPAGDLNKVVAFGVTNPVAPGGKLLLRCPFAMTVQRVDGATNAGTVMFNIEERTVPNVVGTDILTAGLTADQDGAFTTSFANAGLAAGSWLYIDLDSVNTATELSVTVHVMMS